MLFAEPQVAKELGVHLGEDKKVGVEKKESSTIGPKGGRTHPLQGLGDVVTGLLDAVGVRLRGLVAASVVLSLFFIGRGHMQRSV